MCEVCHGEGRKLTSRYGGNDPDTIDEGPCPACKEREMTVSNWATRTIIQQAGLGVSQITPAILELAAEANEKYSNMDKAIAWMKRRLKRYGYFDK